MKWLFTELWQWILSWFQAAETQAAITQDTKTIEEKIAATRPVLDNIEVLKGELKAKSGEVTVLTDKVADDDAAVAKADADTKDSISRINAIKAKTGITQSELADKLDKINLDDG